MSYDLVAFEPRNAPRELDAFLEWFAGLQDVAEEQDSLEAPATENMRAFHSEMVGEFPDMNGESGEHLTEGEALSGYEFWPDYILMDFRWSVSETAMKKVLCTAPAHGLGVYDLNDAVAFPDPDSSWLARLMNKFRRKS